MKGCYSHLCMYVFPEMSGYVPSSRFRSTGIVPAITSTAGADAVRHAEAIRHAAVLYTYTSSFARFLTSSISTQILLP